MNWQTTYPTVATVMAAGFDTLHTWDEKLPAAQTDVERTVRRRIKAQMAVQAKVELRKVAPEVADQLDSALDKVLKLLGARRAAPPKKPL